MLAAAATFAATATAAPEPGTPLPTTPGVPGHGRAWELVSPGEQVSAVLWGFHAVADDGSRVSYAVSGQLPGSTVGEPAIPPVIAVRGADGWTSTPTLIPHPELILDIAWPLAFNPNLTISLQPDEAETILYKGPPEGPFEPLVELEGENTHYLAASADLQHIVFRSAKHYLPGDAGRTEGESLYELDGSELRLVDVDNDGALLSTCGVDDRVLGDSGAAISRDGGRIFFALRRCGDESRFRIYLREGGTTTEISASQCDLADCGSEGTVALAGITPSGSSAFLFAEEKLTNEDSDGDTDFYRYDLADHNLTLLSGPSTGLELNATRNVLKAARDGSRVYFSAVDLAYTETSSEEKIYVAENGKPRRVPGAAAGFSGGFMQASGDARYLVYTTNEALVQADTDTVADVYRYDAEADKVTLISTGPTGGNGPLVAGLARGGLTHGWVKSHDYRVMSDDGSRIFFTTDEGLLAADRNEVQDVYEWADGSLALVSSGTGDAPAGFLGSDVDGTSAFFATDDTLLPEDRDGGLTDYYVARIGGGFAPPAPAPECDRASCPAPAREPFQRPPPASAETVARGIQVRHLGAAERRRVAATGRLVLLAEAPGPGRLSAAVRARIGSRPRTVAAASATAAEAGPVELRMRLAKAARRSLAQGHRLNLRVLLRAPQQGAMRRLGIVIEPRR